MSSSEQHQPGPAVRGRLLATPDLLDAVLAQVASLVEAGEPLVPGLREVADEQSDRSHRAALLAVAGQLELGEDLSSALHHCGAPDIVPAVVEAAQRSGRVGEILQSYVQHRRQLVQMQRRLIGSLAYPLILFLLTAILGTVLLGIFAPQFDSMYRSFGTELPLTTHWLLSAGLFMREYGIFILAVVLAVVLFVALYSVFSSQPAELESFLQKIPRIGWVLALFSGWNLRLAEQAWLSRLLASLLRCDVPLPEAFDLAAPAAQNRFNRQACRQVAEELRQGEHPWREEFSGDVQQHLATAATPEELAEMLEEEAGELRQINRQRRRPRRSVFSSGLLQYLYGAATAGEAADMLDLQADLFDSRAVYRVGIVQVLAEPLLVVLIGTGIGVSIILLLSPLIRLTSSLM